MSVGSVMLENICLYTRSYRGDREFLPFLYKSIEKYCVGVGEVLLILEAGDLSLVSPFVPPWVKIITEESFCAGSIQHKYSKITADFHTQKPYIFHIDSDSVFTRPLVWENLQVSGRPYLEYASYNHLLDYQNSSAAIESLKLYCLENVLPNELKAYLGTNGVNDVDNWMSCHFDSWCQDHFNDWFLRFYENWSLNYGIDVWREGTEAAIGFPVEFEFSRRPEKLYPRQLYALARERISQVHGLSFKDFIKTRKGRQAVDTLRSTYFSDLNFLGACLYYFMYDSVEWIDIAKLGYDARPRFVEQFISFDLLLPDGTLKPGAVERILKAIG